MITEIGQLGACLTRSERRESVLLLALAVLSGGSEFVTIGALVPFLTLLLMPQDPPMVSAFDFAIGWLPSGDKGLFVLAALIALVAIVSAVVRLILVWRSEQFCARVGRGLSQGIYSRVMREDIASFDERNSSDIVARIDKIQGLVHGFVKPLLAAATNAIIALCLFALLMVIAPLLTLGLSIALGLIYAAISIVSVPYIRGHSADMSQGWDQRMRTLRESLGAKREVMLSRSFEQFEGLFTSADWRFRVAFANNQAFAQSPRAIFQPGVIIAVALAASVAVWIGAEQGSIVPVLAGVALATQRLLPLAQGIWNGVVQATGNREVVRDVLELRTGSINEEPLEIVEPLNLTSRLDCRDLDFAYGDGTSVLENVDLTIEQGEWIGVFGPSGAGKSTLLDLLIGFRQPTKGAVEIDGVALEGERLMGWQRTVGYVREASFLLDGTIADNICFGVAEADRCKTRLQSVLTIAGLTELIASLQDGLAAKIGESGVKLSAGQRQRIAIARALYREPSVLILDEATNAMDLALEEAIFAAIGESLPDVTLIMVSHRTQSIARCDRYFEVRALGVIETQGPLTPGDHVVPLNR